MDALHRDFIEDVNGRGTAASFLVRVRSLDLLVGDEGEHTGEHTEEQGYRDRVSTQLPTLIPAEPCRRQSSRMEVHLIFDPKM